MKQKNAALQEVMDKLTENVQGQYDRHGNFIFLRNTNKYRFHPSKRVVRFEVQVNMGTHKEWVRLNSYSKKSMNSAK